MEHSQTTHFCEKLNTQQKILDACITVCFDKHVINRFEYYVEAAQLRHANPVAVALNGALTKFSVRVPEIQTDELAWTVKFFGDLTQMNLIHVAWPESPQCPSSRVEATACIHVSLFLTPKHICLLSEATPFNFSPDFKKDTVRRALRDAE